MIFFSLFSSEDANRSNSTEEERENSEDADDSWDQVLLINLELHLLIIN